jgi:hypothetical protein
MSNMTFSKKQREELLSALKTRFEKNMNRHKGLAWAEVLARLEANTKKLWSLSEMERTGGEPDVFGLDKKRASTFFMIARRKVRKGAEVFATTARRWTHGKKISQRVTRWRWRRPWALSF